MDIEDFILPVIALMILAGGISLYVSQSEIDIPIEEQQVQEVEIVEIDVRVVSEQFCSQIGMTLGSWKEYPDGIEIFCKGRTYKYEYE